MKLARVWHRIAFRWWVDERTQAWLPRAWFCSHPPESHIDMAGGACIDCGAATEFQKQPRGIGVPVTRTIRYSWNGLLYLGNDIPLVCRKCKVTNLFAEVAETLAKTQYAGHGVRQSIDVECPCGATNTLTIQVGEEIPL